MKQGMPPHDVIDTKLRELAALFEPGTAIVVHVRCPSAPNSSWIIANFDLDGSEELTEAITLLSIGPCPTLRKDRMQ